MIAASQAATSQAPNRGASATTSPASTSMTPTAYMACCRCRARSDQSTAVCNRVAVGAAMPLGQQPDPGGELGWHVRHRSTPCPWRPVSPRSCPPICGLSCCGRERRGSPFLLTAPPRNYARVLNESKHITTILGHSGGLTRSQLRRGNPNSWRYDILMQVGHRQPGTRCSDQEASRQDVRDWSMSLVCGS